MIRNIAPIPLAWLDWLVATLLLGYMTLGRSFAHWGVYPIHIGEFALLSFVILRPIATFGPALCSLMRGNSLTAFTWVLFFSLGFGLFETGRGLLAGYPPSITVQCLVFHVYPLFLWIGLNVGRRCPESLQKMVVPFCWATGIYGIAYVFVLAPRGLTDSTDMYQVGVFGQPNWNGVLILALLTFETQISRVALPLMLTSFVFIAMQSRAAWVAQVVCMPVWGVLTGRTGSLVKFVGSVAILLGIAWVADLRIPSPESRHGGELSVRSLAAQVYAMVDPESMSRLRDVETRAGTIAWRTRWWQEIWDMVHAQTMIAVIGPGYGYAIWDLHPDGLDGFPLRTPHNVVMYSLGYTGWIGVATFVALQFSLWGALYRGFRDSGNPFGICLWVICNVRALFDNFFESPQFAITYYLLIGLALALPRRLVVEPSSPEPAGVIG